MSTARMEPPSARQVPTLTSTGFFELESDLTTAVPPKPGAPELVVRFKDPVLRSASNSDEVIGGSDVGAVTPVKPVTPLQVPTGSVTTELWAEDDAGGVVPTVVVVPVV